MTTIAETVWKERLSTMETSIEAIQLPESSDDRLSQDEEWCVLWRPRCRGPRRLQQELLSLKKRLQKTILFVTHDVFEAVRLGDRIAVLHEGRLEQVGPPDDVLRRPATPYVEPLVARMR